MIKVVRLPNLLIICRGVDTVFLCYRVCLLVPVRKR